MDSMIKEFNITRYGRTWSIKVEDTIMENVLAMGLPCEHHMIDWMLENIEPGGIWVDAGANVGNHSIPFSFRADLVVAYEPMPGNFDALERNVAPFANILPLCIGVSDAPGSMSARLGGTGQPCQWELTAEPSKDHPRVDIPVARLDDILPQTYPVRVLKLDVEGMETKALAGAWKTMQSHKPEIFVEVWERRELDLIIATLAVLGYKLIERYGHAPTYHFSTKPFPVTYTEPPIA